VTAPPLKKAYVSWSSGKDAAWSLHQTRLRGLADVVGILTTINQEFNRVAMHGVRAELVDRQAQALGLPCMKVPLPWPCSNAEYEARMAAATAQLRAQGVTHMVFGDLFLEDIRAYREEKMVLAGMTPLFPLWLQDTHKLAQEMLAGGLEAHLACLDPRKLDPAFAGRRFDPSLLADLPAAVDPCGENGEFHTVVTAGPMFAAPIPVQPGEIVHRDGFVFADLIPV